MLDNHFVSAISSRLALGHCLGEKLLAQALQNPPPPSAMSPGVKGQPEADMPAQMLGVFISSDLPDSPVSPTWQLLFSPRFGQQTSLGR